MKEFIFPVTGPDNMQTQSINGEGFVFEVHLTAKKQKNSSQQFLS